MGLHKAISNGLLAKTQGRIALPKMGLKGRADQEVAEVGTKRQSDIVARKFVNRTMPNANYTKKDINAVTLASRIQSGGNGGGGGTIVTQSGEGSTPYVNSDKIKDMDDLIKDPNVIKEHEGFHHVMNQIREKHGHDVSGRILDHLVSHIHPHDIKQIERSLKERGYKAGATPLEQQHWKEEVVNHVRDAVHNELFRHLISRKRETQQRLKTAWKNMRDSANKAGPDFFKSEEMAKGENYEAFFKAEDPEGYKKLASKGVMIGFPATVQGKKERPDIGIGYHSTVKFFDPDKDDTAQIHGIASKLPLTPPDPKTTKIEPGILKDRNGNDVFVLKLSGPHADLIKEHNKKFAHLGHPQNFEYQPHLSVDKATWEKIVASKATTAHEAGIEFHDAELKQGPNKLATYKGKKLEESEKLNYTSKNFLNAVGKISKEEGSGLVGKYNMREDDVRDTINLHKDIKDKHGKAAYLKGEDLHNYMSDNQDLDDAVANKHLERLEHHFGKDPGIVGHAWTSGIVETYKAKKNKADFGTHKHANRIRHYLKGV